MKMGDKFKIISYTKQIPKVSMGIITDINKHSIIIVKENKFNEKSKETFTTGDLIDKYKKKYIDSGSGWEVITFEQRGNKIVPV